MNEALGSMLEQRRFDIEVLKKYYEETQVEQEH